MIDLSNVTVFSQDLLKRGKVDDNKENEAPMPAEEIQEKGNNVDPVPTASAVIDAEEESAARDA